jgi:hypothetical protein
LEAVCEQDTVKTNKSNKVLIAEYFIVEDIIGYSIQLVGVFPFLFSKPSALYGLL